MTAQPALFYRGAVPLTLSTLYTVPAGTENVITSIIIANAAEEPAEIQINLGGVEILKNGVLTSGDTVHFDIRQLLLAGDAIEASASINNITLHVSGVEVA